MRRGWMLAALLCAGLVDCKCKGSGGAGGVQPGLGVIDEKASTANAAGLTRIATQPEWFTCKADTECVHAPADCCGCASGGADLAVHPSALHPMSLVRASSCDQSVCAAVISQDATCRARAVCLEGRCRLQVVPEQPLPPGAQGIGVEPIDRRGSTHLKPIDRALLPPR